MTSIKIPDTPEEVVAQLGQTGEAITRLTQLLTARQWQRAALVACLIGPRIGHGPGRGIKGITSGAFPYTAKALAELGIHGVSSTTTIRKYRDIWCAERPIPDYGDVVEFDGLPPWTGEPRAQVAGTAVLRTTEPERRPEPGDPDYDTEAAAVRAAERAGTASLRAVPDHHEVESPLVTNPDEVQVDTFASNYDASHLNIDRALTRLRDARRSRDEDYPKMNAYQKFGVRGNLTQIKELIEELWPDINEAEEEVMRKRTSSD